MTTALATLFLLGVLILVHELGHYWAARAVGVGVERFSIGFGPRVLGFTRGETEYVISAIPLGGYVKMQGMADEAAESLEGGKALGKSERSPEKDFDRKPIWARALVISAGVIMNMIFAFFAFALVAAAWGLDDIPTTRVMRVSLELLPEAAAPLAGIVPGARIERVGSERPESWRALSGAFFEADSGEVEVETRGPAATFRIRLGAEEERARIMSALAFWQDPVIARLEAGAPAEVAGLQAGDVVTSIAGEEIESWADLRDATRPRALEEVEVVVRRGEELLARSLTVAGYEDPETGEEAGRLGVYAEDILTRVPASFSQALQYGYEQTVSVTIRILVFLRGLFEREIPLNSVGSIGTIAQMSGEAANEGWDRYISFMALFSINLAILNLLPIPILDGGALVLLGVEAARRKPLSVKARLRWSQVGLVLVLLLMAWALSNDVVRFLDFMGR